MVSLSNHERDAAAYFVSTGFPAFCQPLMPSGITNTLAKPIFAARRAASWEAIQVVLAQ